MGGCLAALGRTQGVALWAVWRGGQAGANQRVRPDGLALRMAAGHGSGEGSADGPVEFSRCWLVGLRQIWEMGM